MCAAYPLDCRNKLIMKQSRQTQMNTPERLPVHFLNRDKLVESQFQIYNKRLYMLVVLLLIATRLVNLQISNTTITSMVAKRIQNYSQVFFMHNFWAENIIDMCSIRCDSFLFVLSVWTTHFFKGEVHNENVNCLSDFSGDSRTWAEHHYSRRHLDTFWTRTGFGSEKNAFELSF